MPHVVDARGGGGREAEVSAEVQRQYVGGARRGGGRPDQLWGRVTVEGAVRGSESPKTIIFFIINILVFKIFNILNIVMK